MAQNEIVNVLTIKTEDSQKTIKGLKKEISDLKKVLDNAVIGTEEFEQANRDLKVAQNELKAAMTGQKQSVDALDGSYDALVQEMAKLKKEWRATADVVKRDDLGKQIDNINNQLKELDGTIGNNQRKVGAYAEEFGKALEKNNNTVAASAASFKQALNEQDDATISTRTKLESVQKVTAGLASGYAAVQGTMALLGIENENLEKTFVKLQAAMAIAQGVGGMKDLVEGLSRGKVAFAGAVNGCKAFIVGLSGVKKAIIATGIGALVVAVGLLIANWDKIKKLFDKTTPEEKAKKALAEVRGEVEKLIAQAAGSKIARFKELGRIFNDLGNNLNSKKQFVTQYASELANMGIKMTDVNTAEKIFNDKTGKYVEAVMARAKADAARAAATKKYSEYFEKEAELNVAIKKAEADPVTAGEENRTWYQTFDAYFGIRNSGENYWQKSNQQGQDHIASLKAQKEALSQEREDIFNDLMNEAKSYDKIAQNILGGLYVSGTVGGSGSKEKTPFEEALERVKSALKEQADELLTDEEKLDNEYAELLKKLEGNQEAQLLATEWYINEQTKLLEKELDAQIELNNKIAENSRKAAEERIRQDEENYQKEVAASEKRLNSKLGNIDKKTEEAVYTTERRKPSGNGEINAIDNELSKLETLKKITNETLNLKVAAIDAEMALFEKSTERWKELENQKIALREQTNRTLGELSEQYTEQEKNRNRVLAGSITNTFTAALSSASAIIGALQEGIDTTTKEGFERNKKMQIANATIQMLVGITSALAGAFTTKSGPWDIALAAIQAATIATTGGIQIANIKKQTFDGGGSSTSVTPTLGMSDNLPVSYTRNLMGDMETDTMNAAQRVYILESDIDESLRKVEVRDNNTNF